jgi:hypothetical protein
MTDETNTNDLSVPSPYTDTPASAVVSTDPATPVAPPTPPTMKYLIMRQSMVNDFLHGDGHGDPNLTCTDVYSIYDIVCVKISSTLYNTFRPQWTGKALEIDEETAIYGAAFFSEIRPEGKMWEAKMPHYQNTKSTVSYTDSVADQIPLKKIPVTITPEIETKVVKFMYMFAKMIIEVEFNDRYHEMIDVSTLEQESWDVQKHEAQEFLNNPETAITPFLDYIVQERKIEDKAAFCQKILKKSEDYYDNLSKLLVDFQKLLKAAEGCTTIWDMNMFYEYHFGILMPQSQAIQLGLTVSENDWNRKVEVKAHAFNF